MKRSTGKAIALAVTLSSASAMFAIDTTRTRAVTDDRTATQRSESFSRLDTNRDGWLTRSEWRGSNEAFNRLDFNGDGAISRAEIGAAGGERDRRVKAKHRGMDTNGDGVITRSEWRGNDNSFRQQDRNRDGVISRDEGRKQKK